MVVVVVVVVVVRWKMDFTDCGDDTVLELTGNAHVEPPVSHVVLDRRSVSRKWTAGESRDDGPRSQLSARPGFTFRAVEILETPQPLTRIFLKGYRRENPGPLAA